MNGQTSKKKWFVYALTRFLLCTGYYKKISKSCVCMKDTKCLLITDTQMNTMDL